ncbi:nuclease-related domain-containing protein [Jeotgalibacillus aurantiacus]|uniref:nuclease-related domain-containing protein n=1 Tax=Jeotgalibacillus aurantiacus TaxID=2763266 RepID=UPI001D09F07B|nr:nuclease-related domain-containing protein [Jeotgalibacillus aurantiacus]
MIMKPQALPCHIQTLQIIADRLPHYHQKFEDIQKHLRNLIAGYKGEAGLDYNLSFIKSPHIILHNLRLKGQNHHFQMDTIILFQNAIIILETKNISGSLQFKTDFQQVLRTLNGQTEAFKDFHLQIKRQSEQLTELMKRHKLGALPVIPFIVMANSRTIIHAETPHILRNVIPPEAIESEIYKALQTIQTKKFGQAHMKKVADVLISLHEELEIDWFKKYSIGFSELQMGVQCPGCRKIGMVKSRRGWTCGDCHHFSSSVHHEALEQLFQLKGDNGIVNKDIRLFFRISDEQAARRMVEKMAVRKRGTTKGVKYFKLTL